MARKKRPGSTPSAPDGAPEQTGPEPADETASQAAETAASQPEPDPEPAPEAPDLTEQAQEIEALRQQLAEAEDEASALSEEIDAADDDEGSEASEFKVGDEIEAKWKNGSFFYDGVISRVNPNGTYNIDYNDGDKEGNVPEFLIKRRGEESDDGTTGTVAKGLANIFLLGCGCMVLLFICSGMLSVL